MANEKRLIDANALIAEYDRVHIDEPGKARKLMEDAPTINAVKVIRCRDCKYFGVYKYSGNMYCTNNNGYGFPNQKPDDFCSRGERKDGDENG